MKRPPLDDLRVREHPVLGPTPERPTVTITFEGRPIEAVEGEPIAAALLAAGVRTLRRSERARTPRGVFCNIGHCYECRVVIDGERDVRACLTPVRPGLSVERQGLDAPPRGEGGS